MYGLAAFGVCFERGVAVCVVDDGFWTEHIGQDGGGERVGPHVLEHQLFRRGRRLVHIPRVLAEVEVVVWIVRDFECFGAELVVEGVEVMHVDCVIEHDDAIFV